MSDFVIITAQQRGTMTRYINYVNAILKLKHNNRLDEENIKYKVSSLDYHYYNEMIKENNVNVLNWLNKDFDELIEIKNSYIEIVGDIELY